MGTVSAESIEMDMKMKEQIYILIYSPVSSNHTYRAIVKAPNKSAAWDILEKDNPQYKHIIRSAIFSFTLSDLDKVRYII